MSAAGAPLAVEMAAARQRTPRWLLTSVNGSLLDGGPRPFTKGDHMRTMLTALLVSALTLSVASPALAQGAPPPAAAKAPVNLNTATLDQLTELPGIGRATAQRIVEYRQKNSFKRIEELMNIRGIGEKSFLKLKPLITVAAKPDKPSGER
jgi:competence protein ComEA